MPPHNASSGKVAILEASPVLISKNAPNLAAAKKVADWWMGPQGNGAFAKLLGQYPANSKSDTSYLVKQKVDFRKMLVDQNYRILNRYWEATPTAICEQAVDKFAALGASVIGVSADDIDVLFKFSVSECQGKFPVASDADKRIMKAYDAVLLWKTGYANRTSYVITPDGRIAYRYTDLNPDKHVDNTLAAVREWAARRKQP